MRKLSVGLLLWSAWASACAASHVAPEGRGLDGDAGSGLMADAGREVDAGGPVVPAIDAGGSPLDAGGDAGPDVGMYACARDEHVQGGRCVACDGGTHNHAGDPVPGPDTACDEDVCAVTLDLESCEVFEEAYLKASDTSAGSHFSRSVALSQDGSTLAVGASRRNAVYVFVREDGGTWAQQALLETGERAGALRGAKFGWAVSLSRDGSTLAVGAHGDDSNARGVNGDSSNDDALWSGAAYVFTRAGEIWTQHAYIKASNAEGVHLPPSRWDELRGDEGDQFGISLALSGDGQTLAVGALYEDSRSTGINGDPYDDPYRNHDSGAVYVFVRELDSWSQEAYVKAGTSRADNFGLAVALSHDGSRLAASARVIGPQSGVVHVFERAADRTWAEEAALHASNDDMGDRFGTSLSMGGDGATLAVGAPGEEGAGTGVDADPNDNSASDSGAVYLFVRNPGAAWSQEAYLKASNNEMWGREGFGLAMSLSDDGSTLAVGAPFEGGSGT
ncbi:MAG: hypothetical protein ACFCGT_16140, partial [Sandaracinaceae bacterium]